MVRRAHPYDTFVPLRLCGGYSDSFGGAVAALGTPW
jgi:hypothetical protein